LRLYYLARQTDRQTESQPSGDECPGSDYPAHCQKQPESAWPKGTGSASFLPGHQSSQQKRPVPLGPAQKRSSARDSVRQKTRIYSGFCLVTRVRSRGDLGLKALVFAANVVYPNMFREYIYKLFFITMKALNNSNLMVLPSKGTKLSCPESKSISSAASPRASRPHGYH
jgi:hypothetical protein